MTPAQQETLDYLRDRAKRGELMPTLAELGREFGIARVSARERIDSLIALGLVKRAPFKARGIVLADRCPTCGARR